MEFVEFRDALCDHFEKITEDVEHLFEVGVDKDEMWNLYLDSFPEGTNPIFRERRVYDCSECRQFIRNFGNIVVIKDNVVHTIWDFTVEDPKFQAVVTALSKYIKSHTVTDVYVPTQRKIGVKENHELLDDGKTVTWQHLFINLPKKFMFTMGMTVSERRGFFRDTRNVFERSLRELTEESILTVLELISQNSLYKGNEWEAQLTKFLNYKKEYDKIESPEEKALYAWEKSIEAGYGVGRIRNHSIGTLLINISEDMDLDLAVKKYEDVVAPANYKRPKPVFTKKMLEEAKKKIEDLGYMDALQRRFATLDDISVNNILFSNKDVQNRLTDANDIFASMEQDIAVNPKKFSRVEEITIEDFVNNVLPTAVDVEVLLENKHTQNLVSLITAQDQTAPSMFKWGNNFSWAYTGNITDSDIRENVKSAGGKVNGVLRFSIQWNDDKSWDQNDLDAHCIEPNGHEIMFSTPKSFRTKGELDIDITHPEHGKPAVENITWASKETMDVGVYQFFVHNYAYRGGNGGFRAEIECDGEIRQFDYQNAVRNKESVQVAEVTFDGEKFSIKELLPSTLTPRDVWGVKTNQFVPVSVVMYSPNYWDEQTGIGHQHYFFMLKGCVNEEMPNGFFNEYLKNELVEHKRVFEALGSKAHVADTPDQLSGIGFSSTRRNDLIVKVKGATERILKVKF